MASIPPITFEQAVEILVHAPEVESESHYDRGCILMVEAGQVIAKLTPEGAEAKYKPDIKNVNVAPDGSYTAAVTGRLIVNNRGFRVDPSLEIRGNVDFSTGHIDYNGDVCILGNVVDLFKVKSTGSIVVRGTIEAADVYAAGELFARGGIAGRDKAHCFAGQMLTAKYITGATIKSNGDIRVQSEIAACDVSCCGKLIVSGGPILCAHVRANGGISCHNLGSPAGVKTIVEAGVDESLRALALQVKPDIEKARAGAAQIRETVGPLMRNLKQLTVAQREKATELLYQADEMEEKAAAKAREVSQAVDQSRGRRSAEITVRGTLFPGSVIRVDGLEKTIVDPVDGPVKIVVCDHEGTRQIALVRSGGHSCTYLGGEPVSDPEMDAILNLGKTAATAAPKAS